MHQHHSSTRRNKRKENGSKSKSDKKLLKSKSSSFHESSDLASESDKPSSQSHNILTITVDINSATVKFIKWIM